MALVKCTWCAELIAPDAVACKHCGAMLGQDGYWWLNGQPTARPAPPVKAAKPETPWQEGTKIVVAIGIVAVLLGGFVWLMGGTSGSSSTSKGDDAIRACHEFVSQRLKSPATASFEAGGSPSVQAAGDRYIVSGTVDSQNGFGANLRSNYTCTVTSAGGQWQLESVLGLS